MFSSAKKPVLSGSLEQVETIIGKDTYFKGAINGNGTIRIDGQLEGEISTVGDVVIGETGSLKVQIKARNATMAGTVTGNMDISGKLELLPSAKLYGDIKVGTLIIGEGAVFKGGCEMRREDDPKQKENKSAPAKN